MPLSELPPVHMQRNLQIVLQALINHPQQNFDITTSLDKADIAIETWRNVLRYVQGKFITLEDELGDAHNAELTLVRGWTIQESPHSAARAAASDVVKGETWVASASLPQLKRQIRIVLVRVRMSETNLSRVMEELVRIVRELL